jgi:hypothetical protein
VVFAIDIRDWFLEFAFESGFWNSHLRVVFGIRICEWFWEAFVTGFHNWLCDWFL